MLHAGLDLSRKGVDVCVLDEHGERVIVTAGSSDADGRRHLVGETGAFGGPVIATVESMTGTRFVHDSLELLGWNVEIADAQRAKGLAALACKSDRVDACALAELSRRDLVPAIWLPNLEVRGERRRARFRLHFVCHRVMLANRIHASLMSFGKPCPVSDLFGISGRALLHRLALPEAWTKNIEVALGLIEDVNEQIDAVELELRTLGADHPYVSLLTSAPGIGYILGYTIALEIGDIHRFSSPKKLCGYTGLCPRVHQSGERDFRGPLAKNGPKCLRWALIEAVIHAADTPSTAITTTTPRNDLDANGVRRSPGSRSLASSRKPSGTCARPTPHSLRQGHTSQFWSPDDPSMKWTSRRCSRKT
jgi:transposase